eukprot:Skav216063  [mRNA]  locus=scaffold2261:125284:135159:- [translate_table: standard]
MTVTTYQSDYGSLGHWATAAYVDALDPSARQPPPTPKLKKRSRVQRSKSDTTVAQPVCNSFNPFLARDPPRGKFCSFPSKITRFPFVGLDPLGFTSYGQEKDRAAFPAGKDAIYGSPTRFMSQELSLISSFTDADSRRENLSQSAFAHRGR